MEITYIANVRMPTEKAHGIQIAKMCEAFGNNELKLILPWRFNKIKDNIFNYYGIKENLKIKKIFSLDLIPLNIPKVFFWIQSLTFYISVFFYLLFKKTDIIYSRDSFSLYLLSFFKKNLICEIHTFPNNFFLHKRVFKKVSRIIVITRSLKDSLINKGINKDKILVVPDGVDLEKFDIDISKEEARKKLNLPLNKKIVLYTGHLYKWKGAQVLADAAKLLDNDVLIVFVGGTKEDEEKFKEKNKNLSNILILGHKSYSEMPYYLKSADVLILPNSGKSSISKNWTSPMKMFEYMASKRPIIASNLSSLREILNKDNSILIKSDNSQELADNINLTLKETNFADKISIQAYKDAQNYDWNKRAEKILKFIYYDKKLD